MKRRDSEKEDREVAEVAEFLLGAVSDGDGVNDIDHATGRNIRDQMTIEQAQEIYEEGRLRGFGNRRN